MDANSRTVQATVQRYDLETGSGSALTDAGVRWNFSGHTLQPPIRKLRSGQRVRLCISSPDTVQPSNAEPSVTSVALVTVGALEG